MRATAPATSPNRRKESTPNRATLLQCATGHATRAERIRRRLGRGLAEKHCERRGVVLARAAGPASPQVAAEAAVHGRAGRRTELRPAELHELPGRKIGRQRL